MILYFSATGNTDMFESKSAQWHWAIIYNYGNIREGFALCESAILNVRLKEKSEREKYESSYN